MQWSKLYKKMEYEIKSFELIFLNQLLRIHNNIIYSLLNILPTKPCYMLLNTTFRQMTINTYACTKQGNKEKQKLHMEGKKHVQN